MCYVDGILTIGIILIIYETIYVLFWVCSFTSFSMQMIQFIKTKRQDKRVRTFTWTLFNSLVALATSFLVDSPYAMLAIPLLNELTKYININYFNDLWVN